MPKKTNILFPRIQRLLTALGENIHLARLRRRFSAVMVAERANITRNTLRAIEHGNPGVAFGAYVNVLFVLGLENDLELVACDDILGRKLQDLELPVRARAPKSK